MKRAGTLVIYFSERLSLSAAVLLKRSLLFSVVLILLSGYAWCQSPADSAYVSGGQTAGPKVHKHSPKKATLLSMAMPGLGQIYNRKNAWWKVPAIYAIGGGLVYAVIFYNNGYQEFRRHYRYCIDSNLTYYDVPGYGTYLTPTIKGIRDSYKESRDLYIIYTALFYVIQVVDASVEAHFLDFNVSDNLSLNVQPGMQQYSAGNMAYGLRLTLNLK